MEQVTPSNVRLPRLRADLVPRPALDDKLARTLRSRKLVLMCAPAGYGKTAALVQQLAQWPRGHAVAWVSAAQDDDLHRLLVGLPAALDPFDLPWRISPHALPEVAQRERGLATLVGELAHALDQAEAERGVIVIDDAHRIADARVFEFLELLLEALPAHWTLALATRVDPPLPLARLRVAQELAEFREAELRFDRDDVLALLRAQDPQATAQQAEQLLQSTQGWPAGLSIGLMASWQRAGPARAHGMHVQRRMFEYLAQEVLEQLPAPFQTFLLRCSVLPQWTARRCAEVSGDARAAHWLDELERRDLFVTVLDGEEPTLRLHDLFLEFLQWQLQRDHAEELPELFERAARGEPDPVARVGFLLRASATTEALREMLRVGSSMIHGGADEQVLRLIERFPPAERWASPELAFLQALCAWQHYRFDTMSQWMRRAMEGFERRQQWKLAAQARALAIFALLTRGDRAEAERLREDDPEVDVDSTVEAARELVRYVHSTQYGPGAATGPHLSRLVELLRPRPEALHWMCFVHMNIHMGRWGVRAPVQALVDALDAAADEAHPRMKLMSMLWRAWLAMWRGDVSAARLLREQVVEEAKWLAEPLSVRVPLQHLTAIEKHLTGDDTAAQEILGAMAEEAAGNPGRRSQLLFRHDAGAFAAATANWPEAQGALSTIERIQGPPWPYLDLCAVTLRAELALHRHADREARDLLYPRLQLALDVDSFGKHARLRVALARAELRLKAPPAAWDVLQPLLHEARASGEILGLLMCGPAALGELAAARWPASADPALLALLHHCADEAVRLRSRAAELAQPTRPESTLSERELQVLQLVVQGQSNKLIARALGLSPHTVKRHMARIFDKTGQSSRGQLAAWYLRRSGRGVAAVD